ncbi:mitochondrial GTPase 1-like protein [Paraphysoderma sedebokerense]|nr:mitochondrial GTPase 1-like protein [Paraphysoderma sedebokerense]
MHSRFPYEKVINWFPGHMAKGLRLMSERMRQVDVIIEVRDARIPLSSINSKFESIVKKKDRIVVYNKADLANHNYQKRLTDAFLSYQGTKAVFTDAKKDITVKPIIDFALEKADTDNVRFSQLTMLVVGMPNVGKSSIINCLRRYGVQKGKAAKVGAEPGVTRSIGNLIKVHDTPKIYLLDSPGVMDPTIRSPDQALKIALTGGIKDHVAGEELVADYLLYTLNSRGNSKYLDMLSLTERPKSIQALLPHIAKRIGALQKGGIPNENLASKWFLKKYREGAFGRMTLDDIDEASMRDFFTPQEAEKNEEIGRLT